MVKKYFYVYKSDKCMAYWHEYKHDFNFIRGLILDFEVMFIQKNVRGCQPEANHFFSYPWAFLSYFLASVMKHSRGWVAFGLSDFQPPRGVV